MKLLALTLMLFLAMNSYAQSEMTESDALVARAITELNQSDYRETATAERLLQEAIALTPRHIEAHWQLLRIEWGKIKPYISFTRAELLPGFTHRFRQFEQLFDDQPSALLHYARAHHAYLYLAFDRAQQETDKALALQTNSSRLWYWQGDLLLWRGIFEDNDDFLRHSQVAYAKAIEYYAEHPYPGIEPSDMHNNIAAAELRLATPDYESAIATYKKGIELASSHRESLYAWQKLSDALRHLDRCQEALDAAHKALAIANDQRGHQLKRYAEFCLELRSKEQQQAAQ